MTLRAAYAMHHSGLEEFLYSPVWVERNGSELSVLSAFARLELDPWGEAARLADMPADAAASELARSLARLPLSEAKAPDYIALARRLVVHLPQRQAPARSGPEGQDGEMTSRSAPRFALLLFVTVLLGLLQAAGWLF